MKYLGIDYGSKKVGVAVSDDGGNLAFPKCVIENNTELLDTVLQIIKDERVKEVVFGASYNYKGKENPIMKDIKQFKQLIEERCGLHVHFESEVLTSAQTRLQPHASDEPRSRKKKKHIYTDDSAAALILQSYLDRIKNQELGIRKK